MKTNFLLVSCFLWLCLLPKSYGQLASPLTTAPTCAVAPAAVPAGSPSGWEQVVINEVTGDSGQSDAKNDAIVELAGPAGTDIGGWVVTNGEWAVILPAGTVIPDDGVFMIGCSEDLSRGTFSTSTSGLTCADCDFPGLPLDFDACDPANFGTYVSTSFTTYGFTLDNGFCGESADGDQVMLFRPDGTPHDGIYWGKTDEIPAGGTDMTINGGASGNCGTPNDHISVQDGAYYTLGDNDENGIVNDVIVSHLGRRGDGSNATGVKEMPRGDIPAADPIPCFTMPPITDPVWVYAGCAPTSCNSVYMRINGSDGSHCGSPTESGAFAQNPSHMDDGQRIVADPAVNNDISAMTLNPSCALDTDFANNTAGGGGIPSSSDPSGALSQWGYSDHPNPGQPNDANSWDFSYSFASTSGANDIALTKMGKGIVELTVCEAGDINVTLEVFNFQHVEPTEMADASFYSRPISDKAGSFVAINGTPQGWDTYNAASTNASTNIPSTIQGTMISASSNDGTTTMTFSGAVPVGTTEYTFVWDDFAALGSGKTSTVEGRAGTPSQHECYEDVVLRVTVVESLTFDCDKDGNSDGTPGTPCDVMCPSDQMEGVVNARDYIHGGSNDLSFTLINNDGGAMETNTSGVFQLPTDAGSNGYTIMVTDNSGCSSPLTFMVSDNCERPPVCPESFDVEINGSATPVITCPESTVQLCFNGNQLPPGGTVTWQVSNDGTNYSDIEEITIPTPPAVATGYISQFLYDPDNVPSGCMDGGSFGNSTNPEMVELVMGPAGASIAGYTVGDGTGNPFTFPAGSVVPADGVIVICSGCFPSGTSCDYEADMVGGASGWVFGNSGDEVELRDNNGDIVFATSYENGDCGTTNCINGPDSDGEGSITINSAGTGYTRDATDYSGFGTADGPGVTASSGSGGFNSTPADMTFCVDYMIPLDACPSGNFSFRAEVSPFDDTNCPDMGPDESDEFSDVVTASVTCPTATIEGTIVEACEADGDVTVPVMLSGLTAGNYRISYTINGVAQTDIVEAAPATMTSITIAAPTMGKQTIEITDVYNDANNNSTMDAGECQGMVSHDEYCVDIQPTTEVSMSNPMDLTDCDASNNPTGNGSVTVTFTNAGDYTVEYTIDGAGPFSSGVTASGSPATATISIPLAGEIVLTDVVSSAGCDITLPSSNVTVNPPSGVSATASNPSTGFCSDGTVMINLNTETSFAGTPSGGTLTWHTQPTSGASALALSTSQIADPTMFTIPSTTMDSTILVYYNYIDDNGAGATQCVVTGQIEIMALRSLCCSADAGVQSTTDCITLCAEASDITMSSYGTVGDAETIDVVVDASIEEPSNPDYAFLIVDVSGEIVAIHDASSYAMAGFTETVALPDDLDAANSPYSIHGVIFDAADAAWMSAFGITPAAAGLNLTGNTNIVGTTLTSFQMNLDFINGSANASGVICGDIETDATTFNVMEPVQIDASVICESAMGVMFPTMPTTSGDDLDLTNEEQFYIVVEGVSGGHSSVTSWAITTTNGGGAGASGTFDGSTPLYLGPFDVSDGIVTINAEESTGTPTGCSDCQGTVQLRPVVCPANTFLCDCTSDAPTDAGIISAGAQHSTSQYNDMTTYFYVLVDRTSGSPTENQVLDRNKLGFFTDLANGDYEVFAFNILNTDTTSFLAMTGVTAGNPYATPTTGCFGGCGSAPYTVNCSCCPLPMVADYTIEVCRKEASDYNLSEEHDEDITGGMAGWTVTWYDGDPTMASSNVIGVTDASGEVDLTMLDELWYRVEVSAFTACILDVEVELDITNTDCGSFPWKGN